MNLIHVTITHTDCKRPLWMWFIQCYMYTVRFIHTDNIKLLLCTASIYNQTKKHLQSAYKVQWTNLLNNKLSETIINAPEYLRTSFTFATDIHARLLRSSSSFQLYTPKPYLEIYRNIFYCIFRFVHLEFSSIIYSKLKLSSAS